MTRPLILFFALLSFLKAYGQNQISISANSYLGIGINNSAYPLGFSNNLGSKISFWSDNTNNYGIGIQTHLLQLHTEGPDSDIAFGYGNSNSFTEYFRFKANGYLGVNTNSPSSRIQVNHLGNYNNNENSNHAFLIKDPNPTTPHFLYMGTDAANNLSYIQSVAQGAFKPLLLQGRGGNVGIGVPNPVLRLEVNGNAKTTGDIYVQNDKGIVRNSNGTQLKILSGNYAVNFQSVALPAGQQQSYLVNFAEAFPDGTIPKVMIAGLTEHLDATVMKAVYNVVAANSTSFVLGVFNPTNTNLIFTVKVNYVALGQAQ